MPRTLIRCPDCGREWLPGEFERCPYAFAHWSKSVFERYGEKRVPDGHDGGIDRWQLQELIHTTLKDMPKMDLSGTMGPPGGVSMADRWFREKKPRRNGKDTKKL